MNNIRILAAIYGYLLMFSSFEIHQLHRMSIKSMNVKLEFVEFRKQSVIRTTLQFPVLTVTYVLCLLYRAVCSTTSRLEVSADNFK